MLRQDRLYPHPEMLVTFIGNHDMKRFLTDANGSPEKLKLAFSLLATLRGIPQLYYGDEIGMAGGDDPDNRHDFPGGFPGDQHNAFTQPGAHRRSRTSYAHVQSSAEAARRSMRRLRTGVQKHVAVADKYYAFTRETDGERLLIVFHNRRCSRDRHAWISPTLPSLTPRVLTPIFARIRSSSSGEGAAATRRQTV